MTRHLGPVGSAFRLRSSNYVGQVRRTLMIVTLLAAAACARPPEKPATAAPIAMTGPLIAATVTMKAAWVVPQDPLADKTLDQSRLPDEARCGVRSLKHTPGEGPRLAPSG